MTDKEIRPIKLKASWAMKKHEEGNSSSSRKALVKVKLEKDKHVSSDDGSSGKALVTVKLEKEESEVLVASGVMKRKRISRLVEKSRRFSAKSESSLDKQKTCHRRGMTTRWNTERIDNAERALFEILKEKGASFERPVPRAELRVSARRRIGDTGLLDHLLKHIDGNVTPGGAERFRRCHNTEGTMQYWLESADLIKIKLESGVCDSNWAPPSWWKLPNVNNIIKLEPGVLDPSESPAKLKEEMDKMRSEIKELVSDLALIKRESGIPDLDSIPLAQWKIQSISKESSAVSSKLREEIDKMKSDLKKHISKPELPNNADANEKLIKDFMSWRVKTEKQIAEISNSLASTQCMVKELVSWKDKVEKQLVGIANSQNGRQANGSNSFSPDPQNWEHLLHSANLDDFTGDGFEPWDVDTDLIDALPEAEAVRPDTYLLPPNARKSSLQDHMWFEEQSVLNSEMQRTESCMTRGDSRSSNQDKAELTPGSSMTAGPRSDIEDPNIISPETLASSFFSYDVKSFHRINFDQREILEALVDKNIVGHGGSGTVYRVQLKSGEVLAVKKLWSQSSKDSASEDTLHLNKGLKTEVETLGSIRHKNIVKLFSYFSSLDCSLLVYEYMPNGNLWDALHKGFVHLEWSTRHKIAVGVAQGLAYLHHDLSPPIIHRDIKSTNILLDVNYQPKVADFGIAKVLQARGKDSTTTVIAGTYGYLAPEYAYSSKATIKCDVYSFGVMLMELITGKKPVDSCFGENKNIVNWVSTKIDTKEGLIETLDKRLSESSKTDMINALRVAIRCTSRTPTIRPSMNEVVQLLIDAAPQEGLDMASKSRTKIKDAILSDNPTQTRL